MRYRLAKVCPCCSSTGGFCGAVAPGCVSFIVSMAVMPPIERIIPVVMLINGNAATASACASHFSRTSSREDEAITSPPAACAVSYEM